jgi:predicted acylesterase/phospholipase RssA
MKKSHFALVLPGAVAKGAFEAGVIDAIVEHQISVDRIVATSSGALNGIAYAAGIRSGREKEMALKLTQSWIENGEWNNSLHLSPLNWIRGRGLSGPEDLLKLMRELIKPCTQPEKRDVELRIIIAPLEGVRGKIGKKVATTFEKVLHFKNEDFDTQEGLERIFQGVCAACAFPGLFAPVNIEGLGPCVDGGAVNNAPIAYALSESDVNRVIMPVPFPSLMTTKNKINGFNLLSHLIEILINERLYRELKSAQIINEQTENLEKLVAEGKITAAQLKLILDTLDIRKVEITEIRPDEHIRQSAFAGFFKKADRVKLIDEGRRAAREILALIPASNPEGRPTT